MSKKAGLGLVAVIFAPGVLLALALLWPLYTSVVLLAVILVGSIYLALFVWPNDPDPWA